MAECRVTNETEANDAIAGVVAWLETAPDIDAETVLRKWAHDILDDRVNDMFGCPLCQN